MTRIVRALILLEALANALWIASLAQSLPARDGVTLLLVLLRAAVTAFQLGAFMLLLRDRAAGRAWGRWSLAASGLLVPFEIGWRLVPTNTDPTYRWWFVGAYWGYAALAWLILRPRLAT